MSSCAVRNLSGDLRVASDTLVLCFSAHFPASSYAGFMPASAMWRDPEAGTDMGIPSLMLATKLICASYAWALAPGLRDGATPCLTSALPPLCLRPTAFSPANHTGCAALWPTSQHWLLAVQEQSPVCILSQSTWKRNTVRKKGKVPCLGLFAGRFTVKTKLMSTNSCWSW